MFGPGGDVFWDADVVCCPELDPQPQIHPTTIADPKISAKDFTTPRLYKKPAFRCKTFRSRETAFSSSGISGRATLQGQEPIRSCASPSYPSTATQRQKMRAERNGFFRILPIVKNWRLHSRSKIYPERRTHLLDSLTKRRFELVVHVNYSAAI